MHSNTCHVELTTLPYKATKMCHDTQVPHTRAAPCMLLLPPTDNNATQTSALQDLQAAFDLSLSAVSHRLLHLLTGTHGAQRDTAQPTAAAVHACTAAGCCRPPSPPAGPPHLLWHTFQQKWLGACPAFKRLPNPAQQQPNPESSHQLRRLPRRV